MRRRRRRIQSALTTVLCRGTLLSKSAPSICTPKFCSRRVFFSLSLLCFPCAGVSFCGFSFSVVVEEDFHRICERCACSSSSVLRVNRLLDDEWRDLHHAILVYLPGGEQNGEVSQVVSFSVNAFFAPS